MKTVYMYMRGENPMKYFFRAKCQPTETMCWFSTRLAALQHYYRFNVDELDDESWTELNTSSLKNLERFYAAFEAFKQENGWHYGPDLIEIPLDSKFEVEW
jgi:hypothetical protein